MRLSNTVLFCTGVVLLAQACSGQVGGAGLTPTERRSAQDEEQAIEPTLQEPEQITEGNPPNANGAPNPMLPMSEAVQPVPSGEEGSTLTEQAATEAVTPQRSDTCVAPPGVNPSPRNYVEFAALINSLPLPTTLECFVSSLQRPLGLFATFSAVSAQPARGIRSPRTFLFSGPFIYSLVPDEQTGNILEIGLLVAAGRTVKGELEFPLLEPLDSNEMDRKVVSTEFGNRCGGCHRPEAAFEDEFYRNAFESSVLEPSVGLDASLATVRGLWEACDIEGEPLRCGLFNAIFDHGTVRAQDFFDAVYSNRLR